MFKLWIEWWNTGLEVEDEFDTYEEAVKAEKSYSEMYGFITSEITKE